MPTSTMTSLILMPHRWVRRSITNNDLIEAIDRVMNRLAECQLLVDSVLDRSRASDEPPALQGHHATNTERPAHARRSRWQDEDLVITATLEGRTVQRRPLPTPTERMPRPCPFGLAGADPICQDTVHHLFTNHAKRSHVTDHAKPPHVPRPPSRSRSRHAALSLLPVPESRQPLSPVATAPTPDLMQVLRLLAPRRGWTRREDGEDKDLCVILMGLGNRAPATHAVLPFLLFIIITSRLSHSHTLPIGSPSTSKKNIRLVIKVAPTQQLE